MLETRSDWYNPNKDVCEVDQFGYIDLADAYASHSIPTVVGEDNLAYNNIADPLAAFDMPKDVFEVLHMNKTIHDYKEPETTE